MGGVGCGLLGLPAVYLAQRHKVGRTGFIAALAAGLGLIGIAGFVFANAAVLPSLPQALVQQLTEGPTGMAIFGAVILYVAGVVALVATSWRVGIHPKGALALWGISTAPTIAAIALPPVVMVVAEMIAGLGVVWLAFSLYRRNSQLAA